MNEKYSTNGSCTTIKYRQSLKHLGMYIENNMKYICAKCILKALRGLAVDMYSLKTKVKNSI